MGDDEKAAEGSEALAAGTPYAEAVDSGPEVPDGGEVVIPEPAPEVVTIDPNDPSTMVEMWHPGPGDDTSLVTRTAFDEQWGPEGWREVVARTEEGGFVLAAKKVYPEGDGSGGDAGGSTDQADAEPATEGPAPDDPIGTESDVGSRSRSRSTK